MRMRLISALVATVTAVGLTACGGDDDTNGNATAGPDGTAPAGQEAPESDATARRGPEPTTIVVRGGKPVGGPRELEYDAGEEVLFQVRSDVADEVHVHGYDVSKDVPAGGKVTLSFTADIEGIFEVELEERGEQIAEIQVNP
jgi:hypothetical protein